MLAFLRPRCDSVDVVPHGYLNYFEAACQAAGALVGLLFVVIALRPGRIVGSGSDPVARGLAASSFTGLVNAFFISLLALIPGKNLGDGAAILALIALYHTLKLHLGRHRPGHVAMFLLSLLAYGLELGLAIDFIFNPHDGELVNYLAFVLIGLFSVALGRAWQLIQSDAVAAESPPAPPTV